MLYNLNCANELMEKYKIDALIATGNDTLKYFGYSNWFNEVKEWMLKPGGGESGGIANFCIIPYKKEPIYILEASSVSFLKGLNKKNVFVYDEFRDLKEYDEKMRFRNKLDRRVKEIFDTEIFKDLLGALDFVFDKFDMLNSRLGLEEVGINCNLYLDIKKKFNKCDFKDASEIFRLIRMIKSPDELEILKQCLKITEKALLSSAESIKPGKLFGDINQYFKSLIEEKNAIFDHYVIFHNGFGVTDAKSYIFEEEKIIGIDAGIILNDYFSDTGLTIFTGRKENKDNETYKKLFNIIKTGFEAVKPGVLCSNIYEIMLEEQKKYGLDNSIVEGHGIGISFREYPVINGNLHYKYFDGFTERDADFIIERDMVFNIEVTDFLYSNKTFHIEITVCVKENGCEELIFHDREEPIYL